MHAAGADGAVPLLVLTGPCGVGKTAVLHAAAERAAAAGAPHAAVDMDALRACYPAPPADPFHTALGLRNLAAVWANYRGAGARRLLLADVVERAADVDAYRLAVPGARPLVVGLRAEPATLAARLQRRETGAALAWHVRRAAELAEVMARESVADLWIETDGRAPAEVAAEVLARAGWPGAPA